MAPPSASRRATSAPAEPASGLFGISSLPALLCFGGLFGWLLLAPYFWSGVWVVDYDYWPQALVLLCGAGLTTLAAVSRLQTPRFGAVAWLLALFLGWNVLAVLAAPNKHDAWLELTRVTGALSLFFLVRLFPAPKHRLALVAAAVLGLTWPSLFAIWDFTQTHNSRQFGSYLNPNWFANALAMALPLALVLPVGIWSFTRKKTLSWLALVPAGVLFPALAVTSSKGGFVAAAIALFITVVALRIANPAAFGRLFRRLLPLIAVAVVVFGLLVAKTVGPRLMQTRGADDNSTQFRAYLWRGTVAMVKAKPLLGHGPGSFPDTYPRYALAGYTRTAHQSWLQIAAESGVPAVLLLLGATLCALASGAKALRSRQWPLAAGAIGGVTALLVHGCFDSGWTTPSIVLLFAFALALLEVPTLATTETAETKEIGLGWSWLVATLILGLGGYGTQIVAQGEDAYDESKRLLIQSAPELALQKAQSAVAVDTGSARNWGQLGRLQSSLGDPTWKDSLQKAVDLNPNRAQNYHNFALAYENLADVPQAESYLQKTLERDPLNTQLLLERAQLRLDHKDGRGIADLETILKLWNEPYGRYPAIPDWVNLDFARAVVSIAPQLQTKQKARLSGLVKHALADVANARLHQEQNKAVLQANGTDSSLSTNDDLDELETSLKALQSS